MSQTQGSGELPSYEEIARLADLIIAEAGKAPFEIARAAIKAGYRRPAEAERTRMWRDLVEDRGIDRANRDWPTLDPERGGPGYART